MKIKPTTEEYKRALFEIHELCFKDQIEEIWGWDDDWQWDYFCMEWNQAENEWRVLLDGDRIIGYLCWAIKPDHIYIKNISLIPDYQGRGLGKTAMKFMEEQATEQDLMVKLSTFKTNDRAKNFYEKLGYKVNEVAETGYRMSKER